MKETKTRRITQRTSALLLAGILCVSAFAGSASAQGKEEKIQVQQVQIEAEAFGKKAEKNEAGISDAGAPHSAEKHKEDTAASKDVKQTAKAEEDPSSNASQEQIAQVLPGNFVRFTVRFEKHADAGNSAATNGDETASVDVTILEKADTAASKEDKKDGTVKKDAEEKKTGIKDKDAKSADEAENAEETDSRTYTWQVDRKNGKGWKDIPKANGDSYQIKKVTERQNGWEYRCIISNSKGSVESASVTLQVGEGTDAADKTDNAKKV